MLNFLPSPVVVAAAKIQKVLRLLYAKDISY